MSKPIYHRSDLKREVLLVKCGCRQVVRVPVEGCQCRCGIRHVRREVLPGKVRERVIGGEGCGAAAQTKD